MASRNGSRGAVTNEIAVTLDDIIKLVSQGGMVTLLIAVLVGGQKGWWVYGRTYDDIVKDRDAWQHMAESLIGTTERAIEPRPKATPRPRLPREKP